MEEGPDLRGKKETEPPMIVGGSGVSAIVVGLLWCVFHSITSFATVTARTFEIRAGLM
ncbi:hypothetical protein [Candidatus Binatus sp.]|uniref:hypothetical protein n=1 Tax=Candidatus Binatus sp. TaxID=2811406 RepID=UPI003C385B0B